MTIAHSATKSILILFLISIGTLFFRVGKLPFLGADEPRYARVAEEMLLRDDWVTPRLEGRPWLEKPPFYYWITASIFAILGVSELSARLGPAICALAASLGIYWLGRRTCSAQAGLYGGLILLTSLGFVSFGRSASTDMPLTGCLTLSLVFFGLSALDPKFPAWGVWGAYFFLGLSVLAKGPVALLLVAGIGALFWWLDDRGVPSLRKWQVIPGILIIGAVTIPWFWLVFRENGFSFVSVFVINHHLARYVSDIHHHTKPFYYFFLMLPVLFFPWSGWLPALWPQQSLRRFSNLRNWSAPTLFIVCWLVFPLVFFSLSASKLSGYVLPCLPPIALLLGKRVAELDSGGVRSGGERIAPWTFLVFSIVTAVSMPIYFQVRYCGQWMPAVWVSLVLVAPAVPAFRSWRRGHQGSALKLTLLQGFLLIITATQFVFPILADYHSTRYIARKAIEVRANGEPVVAYGFFHHTLAYYLEYQVAANLRDYESLERYALTHPDFLIAIEKKKFEELQTLEGFSIAILASQGNLRLLRVTHN